MLTSSTYLKNLVFVSNLLHILINRHYKTNIKSKKTKISAKIRFARKTIRLFFDSLRKSWNDRTKNFLFNWWFSSKFFSFSCRVLIWHVTSCQRRSLRSRLAKWSFDSFFVFIRCEFVQWKVSKSFQLIDSFDILWTCRIIINAFSLFTIFFCSWWISEFFRWCSITRSIDTFSRSCNLFYRFFSTWWYWFFWTLLNDTFVVCKRWITKWAITSWWRHKFWTIC
jgi:hypothetical protein